MSTWADGYDAAVWHADPAAASDDLADDEGAVYMYCTACQGWRWCSYLCEGAYEGDEADADWARVCESCGSWVQEGDGPEPEVPLYVVAQEVPYHRVVRT